MNVAIIGAGAAGLNAARHCQDPKYNIKCDVFEQTNHIGGTWIYTDYIGVDKDGLPVHTSMYEGLRTNLPKELMNFPDFKFPDYEKSFLTQKEVLKYLNEYVEKFQLQKYIKFHHQVTNVTPIENNRWVVTTKNLLNSSEVITKEYDGVLVCSGHFTEPIIPDIPGTKTFLGKIIHSRQFRSSKKFSDEKVLVLGAGPSGRDVALHLAEDAKKVYLSHRKPKITSEYIVFPENVEQVPSISKIMENSVILTDNTTLYVDSIVWCTGYKYYFPFLSEKCKITVDNNWVKHLYKHLVNIEYPTMAFIGLQFSVCPFPLFDFQNRCFLNHLNKTITLPLKEEMYKDTEEEMETRWAKGWPKKLAHYLGKDYQAQYFADIANIGKLKPLPPVYIKMHNFASGKIKRHLIFKVIDEDNFKVF